MLKLALVTVEDVFTWLFLVVQNSLVYRFHQNAQNLKQQIMENNVDLTHKTNINVNYKKLNKSARRQILA